MNLKNIVRTKSRAAGGITEHENKLMDEHARLWIARAMRTDPIEPDKIIPAIEGLYRVVGLKKPRVVIVPSPLAASYAYGASAAIWYRRRQETGNGATAGAIYMAIRKATERATCSATDHAAHYATGSATWDGADSAVESATWYGAGSAVESVTEDGIGSAIYAATYRATNRATHEAISKGTRNATDRATSKAVAGAIDSAIVNVIYNQTLDHGPAKAACRDVAGEFGIQCAVTCSDGDRWHGGNMWADEESYLTACRDILGLDLKEHAAYAFWEQAAIHGGVRIMHEEFCLVSDFPEIIMVDAQNRPHCATGPSHRWRDGWALYHWHGVPIPSEWIETPSSLTPSIALVRSSLEQRRAACEILGWSRILRDLNATTIDSDPDPQIGDLVEVELPGLPNKAKFLRVRCGTGREFAIGIPPHITKALDAQAWMVGLEPSDFVKPEVRA